MRFTPLIVGCVLERFRNSATWAKIPYRVPRAATGSEESAIHPGTLGGRRFWFIPDWRVLGRG